MATPQQEAGSGPSGHCNMRRLTPEEMEKLLTRNIPSALDGMKPHMRKLLGNMHSNTGKEVRVSQLAGQIGHPMEYHHGEASLPDSIASMGMEQGFPHQSPLVPTGSFGSRIGGDAVENPERYNYNTVQEDILQRILERQKVARVTGVDVADAQRSPDWIRERMEVITASAGITTLDENKHEKMHKFILGKCDIDPSTVSAPATVPPQPSEMDTSGSSSADVPSTAPQYCPVSDPAHQPIQFKINVPDKSQEAHNPFVGRLMEIKCLYYNKPRKLTPYQELLREAMGEYALEMPASLFTPRMHTTAAAASGTSTSYGDGGINATYPMPSSSHLVRNDSHKLPSYRLADVAHLFLANSKTVPSIQPTAAPVQQVDQEDNRKRLHESNAVVEQQLDKVKRHCDEQHATSCTLPPEDRPRNFGAGANEDIGIYE